jgi:methylated-DNA-[protein]-cysteine S-methyltransferase
MDYAILPSELGDVVLTFGAGALSGLYFDGQKHQPARTALWQRRDDDPLVARTARFLARYFAGEPIELDVPLDLQGTPFQRAVWQALREIPRGTTRTYGEIARQAGSPAAVRAAGAAIGRNPVSIVVPCHRVLGTDGSLTGYAGGLNRKRHLLMLEGALSASLPGMP